MIVEPFFSFLTIVKFVNNLLPSDQKSAGNTLIKRKIQLCPFCFDVVKTKLWFNFSFKKWTGMFSCHHQLCTQNYQTEKQSMCWTCSVKEPMNETIAMLMRLTSTNKNNKKRFIAQVCSHLNTQHGYDCVCVYVRVYSQPTL